ncbi:MAG: hypothetical protein AAFQ94_23255 [Bacteroidota bacterium]
MKKQLLLIFALIFIVASSLEAQDVKKNIEDGFVEMQSAIIKKDFEKSVGFIADEIFTIVPKDQMASLLEMTFNNPQMEIVLRLPENIKVSEPQKEGDKYYAVLSFPNIQKLRMLDTNGLPLGLDNEMVKGMNANFIAAAGEDNVSFDDETRFFTVTVNQKAVAISENGKDGWKYLNYDKAQAAALAPLLPKVIVEKLQ